MNGEHRRGDESPDDELRRRLHDLPGPGGGPRLDVAAAVEGARRRRRPKVAAVTAAAAGAGVLIVAPFVVPGLSPLAPTGTSVLSEPGEQGEQDAGAAPEAAQPADSGTDSGTESGGAETGAAFADACGLTRAGDVGLVLRLLEDPADASLAPPGTVEAEAAGLAATVTFRDVDAVSVDGSTAMVAPGGTQQELRLAEGAPAVLETTTGVLATDACGPGNPSAPSPVALVSLDSGTPFAVVGEPWADVR